MSVVFVDSSAWIAIAHQQDSRHAEARAYYRTLMTGTKLVTSNYVLSESITFLTYRQRRRQALELHAMIQSAVQLNLLEVEWVTPGIHDMAWDIYLRYADQTFSFCACTSFALCRTRNVDEVFSFDGDFDVVGLRRRPI